ncbi:hypothetical protein [Hymenobacter terrigena]
MDVAALKQDTAGTAVFTSLRQQLDQLAAYAGTPMSQATAAPSS